MSTKPLVGKRQPGETAKAVQACNDYLRMGPGRSLAKLWQEYGRSTAVKPPTVSLRTLENWSSQHGWQLRAADYDAAADAEMEREAAKHRRQIVEDGFALDHERIRALKRLADLLEGEIYEDDKRWLPDVKQVGAGDLAEKIDITRFNSALIDQFRGTLDDLAKETGGRKQRSELTGKDGGPIETKDVGLTDEERAARLNALLDRARARRGGSPLSG